MRTFTVQLPSNIFTAVRHREVLLTLQDHFRIIFAGPADAVLVCEPNNLGDAQIAVVDISANYAWPSLTQFDHTVPALRMWPQILADSHFPIAQAAQFRLIEISTSVECCDKNSETAILLEALFSLRSLTGYQPQLTHINRINGGFLASFSMKNGAIVCHLTCVTSVHAAGHWQLDAVGQQARYQFKLSGEDNARPPEIIYANSKGSFHSPQTYQHSHRLTWLNVYAILNDFDLQLNKELPTLQSDLQTICI